MPRSIRHKAAAACGLPHSQSDLAPGQFHGDKSLTLIVFKLESIVQRIKFK
jgi:hypothetical protein